MTPEQRKQLRHLRMRARSIVIRTGHRAYRLVRRAWRLVSAFFLKTLRLGRLLKYARSARRVTAKRIKVQRRRWRHRREQFMYARRRAAARGRRRFWKAFSWLFLKVLGLRPVVKAARRLRKRYRSFQRWPGVGLLRRGWKIWVREPIARRLYHVEYHYRAEVRGIHLKEHGRSYERSYKGAWGKLRYRRSLAAGIRKKRAMFKRYSKVSSLVPLDVPFVYIPLHFQPERTTSSLGGVYADQYLLVDLIARSLPEGWKAYVKEHPSQFYPPFAGERSRHQDLYRDLAQIPRVRLVSLSVSTFELIDRSQAVATVTGTAGWEAILRGRPALVVGSPWYRYCDGVFVVSTESALARALAEIQEGAAPDPRKVRLFVKVLTELCARAGLGYSTPDELELGLTLTQHVDRIVAVTERYWDRMRVEPDPSLFLAGAPPLLAGTRAPAEVFNRVDAIGGLRPVRLLVPETEPAHAEVEAR